MRSWWTKSARVVETRSSLKKLIRLPVSSCDSMLSNLMQDKQTRRELVGITAWFHIVQDTQIKPFQNILISRENSYTWCIPNVKPFLNQNASLWWGWEIFSEHFYSSLVATVATCSNWKAWDRTFVLTAYRRFEWWPFQPQWSSSQEGCGFKPRRLNELWSDVRKYLCFRIIDVEQFCTQLETVESE